MLQVQYSLLSAGPDQSAIKSVADDLGIVLIAYSPLALGLLTGGCASVPLCMSSMDGGCGRALGEAVSMYI